MTGPLLKGLKHQWKMGRSLITINILWMKMKGPIDSYSLLKCLFLPMYVSSVQENAGNIIIDSGMAGVFGEYDPDGNLIKEYEMELAKNYIYRVYKYDFSEFLTIVN